MDQTYLTALLISLVALVLSLSVHEFAHAFVANYFGDPTAKVSGRLTLNPLAHIDPLGLMMLFVAHFGWGKPVPVNPNNLRNPRWHGLAVAVAGPISNFGLALIFGALTKAFYFSPQLQLFSVIMVEINVILMVFNLLPIPPLDGSKVLLAIFPPKNPNDLINYLKYGPFVLLFIFIFARQALWGLIGPVIEVIRGFILLQS